MVKIEKQFSVIFDDFINMVFMGQMLFGLYNLVYMGGLMQVSIVFVEQYVKGYLWKMVGMVCQEVFMCCGGLWFGIYYLLNYLVNYSVFVFCFVDFNVGWYVSCNVVFQNVVSKVSGVKLVLDGDLICYNSKELGKIELVVCKLVGQLGMSECEICS